MFDHFEFTKLPQLSKNCKLSVQTGLINKKQKYDDNYTLQIKKKKIFRRVNKY